jgi:hypothetical protein
MEFFLSHKMIALFVAGVLLVGNVSAVAQPTTGSGTHGQGTVPATSQSAPPLKPGGPAGIKEAQGSSDRVSLIASGLILAGILAAVLLIDDDDDESVTTTGTAP